MKVKVVCIHIGARAHYLLPKALESKQNLQALITDTWVSSGIVRKLLAKFPVRIIKSFSNRYSASLPNNRVYSFSLRFLLVEFYLRFKFKTAWGQIISRNLFFERLAIKAFKKLPADCDVLGISYTSLNIFEIAKRRGQKTIVFQIDPGIKEERIVADLVNEHEAVFKTTWEKAPESYWTDWKKELDLSDIIMVNSEWTRVALLEEGVRDSKIKILPLPFPLETKHLQHKRSYAIKFDAARPLRLLFLGTLTLRKGIHLVLEAASKLKEYPIQFILVGHNELDSSLLNLKNVQYKGLASRSETDDFYQYADAFLFPTFSDGFGLTQLEAMAWNLPVIASKCCGEVVVDGFNGITLPECNTEELVTAILKCFNQPQYLQQLSVNGTGTVKKFSVENFADGLANLN
jgi:glycosyltransferase involved in cell wall biosynthesis